MNLLKSHNSGLIYLISAGEKNTGMPAWWYVKIESRQKLPIFLADARKKAINFGDYGAVLYSGWGTEVPEDIKRKVAEEFS